MLRAILDTNIILSAFWSAEGASYQVLRELLAGHWTCVIENHLVTEYEEVLKRCAGEIQMTFNEIDCALNGLCSLAEKWSLCPGWIPILPDPDDEPILQLAFEAKVPYITTRNRRDFTGAEALGIEIISPAGLLQLIRSQP
jgi:predicted nucleic acid-binding protein